MTNKPLDIECFVERDITKLSADLLETDIITSKINITFYKIDSLEPIVIYDNDFCVIYSNNTHYVSTQNRDSIKAQIGLLYSD